MGSFTYKAEIIHVFHQVEEFEVTVTAENEEKALELARDDSRQQSNHNNYDSEHEETYVENLNLLHNEPEEGEEEIRVRCDKTASLFPSPPSQIITITRKL